MWSIFPLILEGSGYFAKGAYVCGAAHVCPLCKHCQPDDGLEAGQQLFDRRVFPFALAVEHVVDQTV